MGVSAAIAAVVVSGYSAYESNQQAKEADKRAKEAAERDKKAQEVAKAEQAADQTNKTRQQIREERIRRAQILQQSQNTGAAGSSGEIGSTGALQTSLGSNLAVASRQTNSANAITGLQQQAADLRGESASLMRQSQNTLATGQAVSSIFSAGVGIYDSFKAPNPAQTQQPPNVVGGFSPATEKNPYDLFR